jgi:Flp pilus assembly pilin Flp
MKALHDDRGATAPEYAILASMIAAAVAGGVAVLGSATIRLFESLGW